jgi:hypothetical protein
MPNMKTVNQRIIKLLGRQRKNDKRKMAERVTTDGQDDSSIHPCEGLKSKIISLTHSFMHLWLMRLLLFGKKLTFLFWIHIL